MYNVPSIIDALVDKNNYLIIIRFVLSMTSDLVEEVQTYVPRIIGVLVEYNTFVQSITSALVGFNTLVLTITDVLVEHKTVSMVYVEFIQRTSVPSIIGVLVTFLRNLTDALVEGNKDRPKIIGVHVALIEYNTFEPSYTGVPVEYNTFVSPPPSIIACWRSCRI